MIAIAESGSTKCDWVFVDQQGNVVLRTQSVGLNPYFHDEAFIRDSVLRAPGLAQVMANVSAVHFYGAGCSSEALNDRVHRALIGVFKNATVEVDHDLVASAIALYDGEPIIAGILGTGSNSCFFDGNEVREAVPALGFILGDEGSGSFLGKRLLTDYFYHRMPTQMRESFEDKFSLDWGDVVEEVYRNPRANVYLASFARFASEFDRLDYVQDMIREGFELFVKAHVLSFKECKAVQIGFVGSVAFAFQPILKQVLEAHGCRLGRVIKHPVDRLVQHHVSNRDRVHLA